jgi:hypothetical protein
MGGVAEHFPQSEGHSASVRATLDASATRLLKEGRLRKRSRGYWVNERSSSYLHVLDMTQHGPLEDVSIPVSRLVYIVGLRRFTEWASRLSL